MGYIYPLPSLALPQISLTLILPCGLGILFSSLSVVQGTEITSDRHFQMKVSDLV